MSTLRRRIESLERAVRANATSCVHCGGRGAGYQLLVTSPNGEQRYYNIHPCHACGASPVNGKLYLANSDEMDEIIATLDAV